MNPIILHAIKYKDGNKLGMRKRVINYKKFFDSKIVIGQKEFKNIYSLPELDESDGITLINHIFPSSLTKTTKNLDGTYTHIHEIA